MNLAVLFSKLEEHEFELNHLSESKEDDRKKKGLLPKIIDVKDMESEYENCQSESDEVMDILFQKFKKLSRNKRQTSQHSKTK